MRAVVVALVGPSGSGKSTLTAAVARRLGWAPIDEAYYRLRPRPSLRIVPEEALLALERRLLDEESRRFREAQTLARGGTTVVADTGFLDPVSYTAGLYVLGRASAATLRAVVLHAHTLSAKSLLGLPDLTVRLSAPAATRRARAAGDPARHPRAYRERHESVGRIETSLLVPWLRGAVPGRMRVVRAGAPVEAVAERVRTAVSRAVPLRDPCRAASRALETLGRLPRLRPALGAVGNLKKGTLPPRPPR
jgi:thymidylate kinase